MLKYDIKVITRKVIQSPFVKNGYCWKYYCSIKHGERSVRTTFFGSVSDYNNKIDLKTDDVMFSLVSDSRAYEDCSDILDFYREFGYTSTADCRKAYKGCEEAHLKLHYLFSDEEIEELEKQMEEKGY